MCTGTTASPFLHNYPIIKLTDEEINNPYLVIKDFFSFGHLPEMRKMMWNFFATTVTGSWPSELNLSERSDLLLLYEYLQRLVEAVHLINEQRKKEELAKAA